MYPDELIADRIRLRPLRLDDAALLHERILTDSRVSRYLTWQPTSSLQETTDRLAGILDEEKEGTSKTWSIDLADSPADPIGMFTVWTTEHGQELGYCLAPEAWGQGLMVEVVTAVTSALLGIPGVVRVWAACDVENHASVRVLERAGFQREGLLRKCAVHPNLGPGHRDCWLYAQVRDDPATAPTPRMDGETSRPHTRGARQRRDGRGELVRSAINPDGVFDSTRFGFSQAVVAPAGRRVHLSGQVAADAALRSVGTDLEEQAAKAFDNIEAVLHAIDGTLDAVMMLRIYIVERAAGDLAPISRVLLERFPAGAPASSWVIVAGLADPAWLVEVEAEAVLA